MTKGNQWARQAPSSFRKYQHEPNGTALPSSNEPADNALTASQLHPEPRRPRRRSSTFSVRSSSVSFRAHRYQSAALSPSEPL